MSNGIAKTTTIRCSISLDLGITVTFDAYKKAADSTSTAFYEYISFTNSDIHSYVQLNSNLSQILIL